MAIGDGQEEQRRAALAAMARAGQQGVAAYQAGLAESQAVQTQALDAAARQAAQLNTGGPAHAELQQIVAQPGNLSQQYMVAGQDRFARDIARQGSANDAYFSHAAAAVPAIKAQADREIGLMRARWEAQAAKEANDLEKWQIESMATGAAEAQRTQDMAAADAKRQALLHERQSLDKEEVIATKAAQPQMVKAGPSVMGAQGMRRLPPDPAAVAQLQQIQARRQALDAEIDRLSGVDSSQQPAQTVPLGPRIMGAQATRQLPPVVRSMGTLAQTPTEQFVPPMHEYQRRAATEGLGINPALAAGMFQAPTPEQEVSRITAEDTLNNLSTIGARSPQAAMSTLRASDPALVQVATKAGINPEEVPKIRQSPVYRRMRQMAEALVGSTDKKTKLPYTRNQFIVEVTSQAALVDKPKTRALLLAEFADQFPGA